MAGAVGAGQSSLGNCVAGGDQRCGIGSSAASSGRTARRVRPTVWRMGLTITVGLEQSFVGIDEEGVESARKSMIRLSEGLADHGIVWAEPPPAAIPSGRARLTHFSYGLIHYLRRAYTVVCREEPLTPVADADELAEWDDEVDDLAIDCQPHLIYHSDCDGTYVPVDFDEPVTVDSVIVGSSQRLLRELRTCAGPLGITLAADGTLTDAEAARVASVPSGHPFRREWEAWLALHEAARVSIATGHAIVFH